MSLYRQQRVSLQDGQGHALGQAVIDRIEDDLVFGQFTPGPDFPKVHQLFADYVDAANEQLLSLVGDLDAVIGALGLHLRAADEAPLPAIHDVQIGAGIITFRIRCLADGSPCPDRTGAPPGPAPVQHPDLRTA